MRVPRAASLLVYRAYALLAGCSTDAEGSDDPSRGGLDLAEPDGRSH